MSFINKTHVKSCRKPCRCFWCGEPIEIGQPKTTTATVFEGDFQASSFHPECYAALKQYGKENPGYDYWPDEGTMKRGSTDER